MASVRRLARPLTLSRINQYELTNALRFAEFRHFLTQGKAAAYLADFDADIAAGKLVVEVCNLADVLSDAMRLSGAHTLTRGCRSFDILHVAAALHLGAKEFLTFDDNQRRIAEAEGMKVPPS